MPHFKLILLVLFLSSSTQAVQRSWYPIHLDLSDYMLELETDRTNYREDFDTLSLMTSAEHVVTSPYYTPEELAITLVNHAKLTETQYNDLTVEVKNMLAQGYGIPDLKFDAPTYSDYKSRMPPQHEMIVESDSDHASAIMLSFPTLTEICLRNVTQILFEAILPQQQATFNHLVWMQREHATQPELVLVAAEQHDPQLANDGYSYLTQEHSRLIYDLKQAYQIVSASEYLQVNNQIYPILLLPEGLQQQIAAVVKQNDISVQVFDKPANIRSMYQIQQEVSSRANFYMHLLQYFVGLNSEQGLSEEQRIAFIEQLMSDLEFEQIKLNFSGNHNHNFNIMLAGGDRLSANIETLQLPYHSKPLFKHYIKELKPQLFNMYAKHLVAAIDEDLVGRVPYERNGACGRIIFMNLKKLEALNEYAISQHYAEVVQPVELSRLREEFAIYLLDNINDIIMNKLSLSPLSYDLTHENRYMLVEISLLEALYQDMDDESNLTQIAPLVQETLSAYEQALHDKIETILHSGYLSYNIIETITPFLTKLTQLYTDQGTLSRHAWQLKVYQNQVKKISRAATATTAVPSRISRYAERRFDY